VTANSRLTTAVHALCWIEQARRRGESPLSSERVAVSLRSHPVLVRRLLGDLRRAGLVESTRGRGAGWTLTTAPERISLRDVHVALGSEPVFGLHPHEPNLRCEVGAGIGPVLGEFYARVDAVVADQLATRTVADVLDEVLTVHPRQDAGPS
jgi:DNA-binding IscR family transcriptional regulator